MSPVRVSGTAQTTGGVGTVAMLGIVAAAVIIGGGLFLFLRRRRARRSGVVGRGSAPRAQRAAPGPARTRETSPLTDTLVGGVLLTDSLVTQAVPVESMPVKSVPVKSVPVESVPVESVHAESPHTEVLYTEAMPTERLPTERLPTERLPTERLPTERLSTESAPTGPVLTSTSTATTGPVLAGPVPPGSRTSTSPTHPPPPQDPGPAVLEGALREVAVVAPGTAIGEEIGRLLDSGAGRVDLLLACIRYRDRLAERDPATGRRLLAALHDAGVEEIRADGELFDADCHDSVDVVAAPRIELHDQVAQTVRPGYRDRHRILRLPQVIVYRFTTAGRAGRPRDAGR